MDSPKCPKCLSRGSAEQTYRVMGKGVFKCLSCKETFPTGAFSEIELKWRENPSEWFTFIKAQYGLPDGLKGEEAK